MNVAKRDKFICCILVSIVLFLGFGVAMSTTDSSCLYTSNSNITTESFLSSVEHNIAETRVCTVTMLNRGANIVCGNVNATMSRWQSRESLLFLVVGFFLQYLFSYQSAEMKEDGQLFLCRSAIVDYIHRKDSGE